MELAQTATGKSQLVVARDVDYEGFPGHAQELVNRFKMTVERKVDGPGERLWLVKFEGNTLCVSWDDWFFEVTLMSWEDTPDDVIVELHKRA